MIKLSDAATWSTCGRHDTLGKSISFMASAFCSSLTFHYVDLLCDVLRSCQKTEHAFGFFTCFHNSPYNLIMISHRSVRAPLLCGYYASPTRIMYSPTEPLHKRRRQIKSSLPKCVGTPAVSFLPISLGARPQRKLIRRALVLKWRLPGISQRLEWQFGQAKHEASIIWLEP